MRKIFLIHISCLIFLLCTATTCEEDFVIPVDVVGLSIGHLDNSAEMPVVAKAGEMILKDAYVLGLKLKFERNGKEEFYLSSGKYRLEDPIVAIRVFDLLGVDEAGDKLDITENFKCYQVEKDHTDYLIQPYPLNWIDVVISPDLYLASFGLTEGKHQFGVEVLLRSGKKLWQESECVKLFDL